jgi:UDP-glucose 4-epimerase
VVDLAAGHLAALEALEKNNTRLTLNLGTGIGYSVLDIVQAFEKVSDRAIPYRITQRRAGDIASCYADSTLAYELMGWSAERDIATMCRDAWRWQSKNPNGYEVFGDK